ncbi:uncharacterized protein LOC111058592 [Nilaparvata lugens]|uniref:uncharacterized protein LOC111058592 n=1 Tax=Nilaparvata lugens TaxID=108931 RepID=UPI00193DD717|nr:uncharacterized protein LOC111058592 [Nilaparvata lugens]XP_022201825.2 uncharacterized protein LOC111058592 [Nilaparvata lugens]
MSQRRSQAGSSRSQRSAASQQSRWSQSQSEFGSQSQTQTQTQVSDEVLEETAMEVVNFLLDHQHPGKPVNRLMITKNIPKTQGRIFKAVMTIVQKTFDTIFGMDLIEISHRNNLRYFLVNKMKSDISEINVALCGKNILAKNERYLLLLFLTVVHKMGGEVRESSLLEFCRIIHIIDNVDKPIIISPYFAGIDLLKFMRNDLVDKLYLECKVNDENGENEMRYYSWGLRAEQEVDQDEMEAHYQLVFNRER